MEPAKVQFDSTSTQISSHRLSLILGTLSSNSILSSEKRSLISLLKKKILETSLTQASKADLLRCCSSSERKRSDFICKAIKNQVIFILIFLRMLQENKCLKLALRSSIVKAVLSPFRQKCSYSCYWPFLFIECPSKCQGKNTHISNSEPGLTYSIYVHIP